ncbi:MAG TPA: response regulator transcription factor [Geobacteraceae bacterium]
MKILICLSSVLLAEALQELLTRNVPECQIAVATDFCTADAFQPDMVMTDARNLTQDPMPRCPGEKIILIDTGLEPDQVISLLLTHRLAGVIDRHTDVALLKKALKAIATGQVWIDNGKIRAILDQAAPQGKNHQTDSLSRKEQEIVMLVSRGLRNREIAAKLSISEQTVKAHISSIFKKAQISRRSQLVPLALRFQVPETM